VSSISPQEFHYKISWRATSHRPGHHRSVQGMGGLDVAGLLPLARAPDARRLDVRASLRDPFEEWWVRRYSQRASVPVLVLADLSASMAFSGEHDKLKVLSEFTAAAAYSAYRTGDTFAFIGCDDEVKEIVLPTHSKTAGVELASRLKTRRLSGGANGLLKAAEFFPRRRSLVFFVSDFHFPFALLESVMETLSRHKVVPLVLWDRIEFEKLPRFGLAQLADSETGKRRVLFVRSRLRKKIVEAMEERRRALSEVFFAHEARALFLSDGFDADALTRYFFSGAD
jgi:hypothetical protein